MKGNILIVEDEAAIRKLISIYLKKEDFSVLEAEDGEEALSMFKVYNIDLVILDIMIPQVDGFKVCQYIRKDSDVPIIMLTAKSMEEDKLRGFEYGADEYVTKPFSPKVLTARVNALLKRYNGKVSVESNVFHLKDLIVNANTGSVSVCGEKIDLTHKEYDLLLYLIQNKSIILSKESILDRVWGIDYLGDPRTIDTHIRRLREKLGTMEKNIVTIRGRGYKFEV